MCHFTTLCQVGNTHTFPRDSSKTTSYERDQVKLKLASATPSTKTTTPLLSSRSPHEIQPLYSFTRQSISEQDFDICRRDLRSCLERCGAAFSIFCFAISLVLNSFRPLHRQELEAALAVLSQQNISTDAIKQDGTANGFVFEENDWLRTSEVFMTETTCGNVDFRMPTMKAFLRLVPIRGIDSSHRTIAVACRRQVIADTSQHNFMTAFSGYATEHWAKHVKIAELSNYIDQSNGWS